MGETSRHIGSPPLPTRNPTRTTGSAVVKNMDASRISEPGRDGEKDEVAVAPAGALQAATEVGVGVESFQAESRHHVPACFGLHEITDEATRVRRARHGT